MGSSSSRIGPGQSSEPSRIHRTKRKISSLLLCGLTNNSPSPILELESPINSIENLPPTSVESISTAGLSSSIFGSEPACTSSKTSETEPEESESCNSSTKNASTSYESQPIQEAVSGNYGPDLVSALDSHSVVNDGSLSSSDSIIQENLDSNENSGQTHSDITRNVDSDTRALLVLSDSFLSLRMFGSGLTTSGPGILVVDTVSVSPNMSSGAVSDLDSLEARRNGGRLFGAASSRRSYRRESDFPALLLTTGLADDLGSRDRWLLDISGDLGRDWRGHGYSRSRNEERMRFRSQMSERGLGSFDEHEHQTRFCASGLHREGRCSCGRSFVGEETASFGSISRVVLLAQALSEVLDEIHRQPLSFSMPMLSLPAPESVVDSFLLKSHKKMNASESGPNYVQQCYICLVDYEEGDKIRVLPCQHEYHAPCVDKWLKEVNGVCPVCRCNVCDTPATSQASVSSSELPV
uniref:E3 ubiquitin-protein ligase RLIM-like n=1 Tax=Erigeron canadensis TaxID=72917 RepID=UPI001CB970C5|nr:E3 ubiquitin-protein ligase RLIM-like [Erigeron canadensis]